MDPVPADDEPGNAFDGIPNSVWGIICRHLSLRVRLHVDLDCTCKSPQSDVAHLTRAVYVFPSKQDLLNFSAVCRSWRVIASDDALWRDLYRNELPDERSGARDQQQAVAGCELLVTFSVLS